MDPSLNKNYATKLKLKCNPRDKNTVAEMDPGNFRTFDTHYYTTVKKPKGLFQSDVAILRNNEAEAYVNAESQGSSVFSDFARSMEKMGRIGCSRALQDKSEDTVLLQINWSLILFAYAIGIHVRLDLRKINFK
jgi:peroxidase